MTSTQFKAWAAFEPKGAVKPFAYTPRPLGPGDVEIKIHYCGMCGSDIHQIDSGWGPSIYPIVPGHEIVGEIVALGSKVKTLAVGQRVGVGAQCDSCGQCLYCDHHDEQHCAKAVFTYNSKFQDGAVAYGGYAEYIRTPSNFVIPIPDNLPFDRVAPLLCAGVTTYSPLIHHQLGEGHHVAVLGIGGLGHLGVKWAKALGSTVTALSSSASKEKDAKILGADEFVCTKDVENLKSHARQYDAILSTVNVPLKWEDYFGMLKPHGKFIMVGFPEEPISFHPGTLLFNDIQLCGSAIGSPFSLNQMMKLASEKNILADVQVFPMEKVNEALTSLREGKPHFRNVLKIIQ